MIRIVTDSAADLTAAELSVPGVFVVPLSVTFADGTTQPDDGTMTKDEFFVRLAEDSKLPCTSQPSPASFMQVYEDAEAAGDEVLVITIGQKLSGTYQCAHLAAADVGLQAYIVDSEAASQAEALLVREAVRLRDEEGLTAEEIAALNPNAALACQLSAADGLTTWRDCVAAIAQLLGGFGTVDRAGRLVIRQFAKTSCVSLGADARSEAGVSDFRSHYAALTVATQSGSYAAGGGQDTGLTMAIADMPLAEKGLPDTRQGITDNLFAELRQLDYTPATVTMPGDPALEPGDRVALPQADGTAPEMLVTHFVWHYHGRQTLKSVGRNPYLTNNSDGTTEKLLRKVQNSAESKRLVYYSFTNTAALTVRTAETPAVSIAFAAVEDTSAMFLAQLLLTAEPEGGDPLTLEVRYYVNEVRVENFTPQQRLLAGAHTLALFYPFASVEANAAKRLSVRLVCTGGTVKIAPYSIKATVTGQGMASELPWDGTLQFEELLMPLQLTERKVILE